MILQQTMMKLSKTVNGVEGVVNKLVLLWEEIGLCIHKSAYLLNGVGYVISHYKSGKIVLRGIKTRQDAEKYMQRLHNEVIIDWTFTLAQYDGIPDEDKRLIKARVEEMQKEIYQKGVI